MGPHSSKHDHQHRRGSTPAQSGSLKPRSLAPTKSDSSISVRKYDLSNFAVIAVIFNPIKYESRYNHYHKFEAHMAESGVTLFTVECIFESAERFGLPNQSFHLTRNGDSRHIQIIAPSILWIKENLINVAIKCLPQHFQYVAWIDADIEFERLDWPHQTIAELQRYPIVQLFELSYFLGPSGKSDILRRDYSFGYSIRKNKPIDPRRYNEWYAHPGYAWAMHRSAINKIGGLLDFCIIGSGDLHFAFALLRRIEETLRPGLHADYRHLAMTWGDRLADVAQNGANVGYVPINIWHHWHGERNDRNYVDRWAILEKHHFSPIMDLQKNNDTGLIRLADKSHMGYSEVQRMEALERDIVAYFQSRNEDKKTKTVPNPQPQPSTRKNPPAPSRTQGQRTTGGGLKPSKISSGHGMGNKFPHLWTSGHTGSHVDDHNPYLDQCTCPGHCHHPDNHDCPCAPHHMDDQHCWTSTDHDHDHHHHHHDNDHDHHHHNDDDGHHCHDDHYDGQHSSHDHHHHVECDNDHSHETGGHHDTDYGGHHDTDYGGHHDTDYGGHHDTDYGGHHDTDYGGHHDTDYGGHHDTDYGGHHDTDYGGHQDTDYGGPGSFY